MPLSSKYPCQSEGTWQSVPVPLPYPLKIQSFAYCPLVDLLLYSRSQATSHPFLPLFSPRLLLCCCMSHFVFRTHFTTHSFSFARFFIAAKICSTLSVGPSMLMVHVAIIVVYGSLTSICIFILNPIYLSSSNFVPASAEESACVSSVFLGTKLLRFEIR